MKLNRRELLKTAAAAAASTLPLSACESIYSHFAGEMGEKLPDKLSFSADKDIDPAFHLLSRAAFGPYPGEIERLKQIGEKAWIEEQLHPEKIDDLACDLRARRFETIHIPAGSCYDFKKPSLRQDIVRHTLLRAVYSKRQLLEVMVEFWTDHLNISLDKGDCVYLKPSDDRLVVRAHALGKFKDLIRASATSPAMLVYLDGKENKKESAQDVPNENYGRELLELHTLGVHGGYTQEDVYEVARCLTGWRMHEDWQRAVVYFDSSRHDDGEKHVLGHTIAAGGGEKDLDQVVEIVCAHPSTANYIAGKLCARFVSDPSPAFVERTALVFARTNGDIKEVLRSLLNSDEFKIDRGSKFKRPFRFIASSLRALAADTHAHKELVEFLPRMGQPPFQYPTPDGYPDDPVFWSGTLLWRWKFALALALNQIETAKVEIDKLIESLSITKQNDEELAKFFSHFIGRLPLDNELQVLSKFMHDREPSKSAAHKAMIAGLILSSPAFQRY